MHTSRMKIMIVGICLLIGLAAPVTADIDVPEEWVGDWELSHVSYDCITGLQTDSWTSFDTICSDSVFEFAVSDEVVFVCSGSADATSYTIDCTTSGELFPGCMATLVYDATATRIGDSYTATYTISTSYVGDCEGLPDSCARLETTAIRVSSSPGPCGSTPAENMSWGTVKSAYR